MNNQDFEAYADFKHFNQKVPPAFENMLLSIPKDSRPELKILDIGCGDGKFYNFLVNNGFAKQNIFGTEVSQKRIDRCHEMGWSQVYWNDEFFALEEKDIDIIIMMEVVEHVPKNKIVPLLLQIKNVLKPNTGSFFITTPQYPIKRFYDYYDAFIHKHKHKLKDDPTHVAKYTFKELEKLLRENFKVERKSGFKDGFLHRKFRYEYFKHKIFLRLTH